MKLSIIIPTKDRGEVFHETLRQALVSIQHVPAEIIVVNDSKTDRPIIPISGKQVIVIDNPKSGVASARNAGVKESTGELLLFLDDDIIISKDSIDQVLRLHQQLKKACFNLNWEYPVVMQRELERKQFGRFLKASQLTSFKGWYADSSWKDNALFPSTSVASFHLSIMKEDFERSKGYNDHFPHAGFEDYDFPRKLKEAGLSFFIDSRVTLFHNEADRMHLTNWLASQERRATTRRVAVSLGYPELILKYGVIKRWILTLISHSDGLLMKFLKIIPNFKIFDPLYFKIIATLQAARIFKGYTSA